MERRFTTEAIVLRSKPVGELHRSLLLATSDRGNIWALAHGASSPKGKLHSAASTFARSKISVTVEPRTGGLRISEADLLFLPDKMRENLQAFWAAGIAAELAASSEAGEDEPEHFALLARVLELLDAVEVAPAPAAGKPGDSSSRLVDAASLLCCYLWNYIRVHGILPDFVQDCRSGRPLPTKGQVWYDPGHDGFSGDFPGGTGLFVLPDPGLRIAGWLASVSFERGCQEPLPVHCVGQLCRIAADILTRFHSKRLRSFSRLEEVIPAEQRRNQAP